jgi:hypothetical protein
VLLATDAQTYTRYVHAILSMEARAEATKLAITARTYQAAREIKVLERKARAEADRLQHR